MIDTFDAFLSERRYAESAIRIAKKHIRLIHEAGYTDDDIRRIDGFCFGRILDVNTKHKPNPWVRAVNMYRAYLRARDNQTIKCFTCKHAVVDFLDDMYSGQRVVSICCHGFPEKGLIGTVYRVWNALNTLGRWRKRMTEYRCKRGFKIDIPEDKCDNEALVHISEPKFRAFCAFCTHKEKALIYRRKSGLVFVDTCDFLQVDSSWDDWEEEEE